MNNWLERNRGYIIVFLLGLIVSGGLNLLLHRPAPSNIRIIPATPTPVKATIHVHVSGAVAVPAVYELPAHSLVRDAIQAAGGHTPDADLNQINLARQLRDEEQIFVPGGIMDEVEPGRPGDRTSLIDGKLNLNTATREQLEELPGIGPSLARSIVEYRMDNGSFRTTEELKNVHGIGDTTYERIKEAVIVN